MRLLTKKFRLWRTIVRRVLAKHYRPSDCGTSGRSCLTFIGHVNDSLWSVDLFRCESILLRSHWVMLVMDEEVKSVSYAPQ